MLGRRLVSCGESAERFGGIASTFVSTIDDCAARANRGAPFVFPLLKWLCKEPPARMEKPLQTLLRGRIFAKALTPGQVRTARRDAGDRVSGLSPALIATIIACLLIAGARYATVVWWHWGLVLVGSSGLSTGVFWLNFALEAALMAYLLALSGMLVAGLWKVGAHILRRLARAWLLADLRSQDTEC